MIWLLSNQVLLISFNYYIMKELIVLLVYIAILIALAIVFPPLWAVYIIIAIYNHIKKK